MHRPRDSIDAVTYARLVCVVNVVLLGRQRDEGVTLQLADGRVRLRRMAVELGEQSLQVASAHRYLYKRNGIDAFHVHEPHAATLRSTASIPMVSSRSARCLASC